MTFSLSDNHLRKYLTVHSSDLGMDTFKKIKKKGEEKEDKQKNEQRMHRQNRVK